MSRWSRLRRHQCPSRIVVSLLLVLFYLSQNVPLLGYHGIPLKDVSSGLRLLVPILAFLCGSTARLLARSSLLLGRGSLSTHSGCLWLCRRTACPYPRCLLGVPLLRISSHEFHPFYILPRFLLVPVGFLLFLVLLIRRCFGLSCVGGLGTLLDRLGYLYLVLLSIVAASGLLLVLSYSPVFVIVRLPGSSIPLYVWFRS
jgi:hypothetical protein